MNVKGLDIETFVGDQPDPDLDEAQTHASTQHEDQDDDPETSPEEKARIWNLLGFTTEERV